VKLTNPLPSVKLVTLRFPLIVVVPELALKVPPPPTAAKLSVPLPPLKVPLIVVVPATVIPSAPADSTAELCRSSVPARLRALVTNQAPVALEFTCRFPIWMAAFKLAAAPVITRVPFVFGTPKAFEMATLPEELIVFAAVLVIVPVLVKSPAVSDPEVSRVPEAPTLKGLPPAATVPPLWICSVPPVTWLVPPFSVRVTALGMARVPPLTVKVPETVALIAVIVPPLTVRLL
jgi:hypothetical protein